MGCESSQMDIEIPRRAVVIQPEAQQFISKSQFAEAEKVGDRYFKEGAILKAIVVYQKIIEANYIQDYEIEGLGNFQHAMGRYEGSIYKWYNDKREKGSFKGNPYDALSLCYCEIRSRQSEDLKEGISWYQEMLSDIQSYQLYLGYANILCSSKKFKEGMKIYNKVAQLKPTVVNTYVSIALLQQFKQRLQDEPSENAKKLFEIYPQNMYAQFLLARRDKDAQSKLNKLKALHEKYPDYARIANEIGSLYEGKQEYNEAIGWFKKCIEAVPEYIKCYISIGLNLEMMKQNQEAMIWFFRACERSTKRKAPYFRLAELFDASGFTENQVESEMDKYPTLDKFTFFYNLGIFYYDRLKIDESLKWYLKAEKLRPTSSKLLNSMGMSYDEKEDYVKSQKYYLKCLEEDPNFSDANYNLAILYRNQNQDEKARKWYMKAVKLNPQYKFANFNANNISKKWLRAKPSQFHNKRSNRKLPPLIAGNSSTDPLVNKQALFNLDLDEDNDKNLTRDQKQALFNLYNNFRQKQDTKGALRLEFLNLVNLIYEDRFELKRFEEIYDLIKHLFNEEEEYFHIIPQLLVHYFEENAFNKKRPYADVEEQLNIIVRSLLAKQEISSPSKVQKTSIKMKHFTPPSELHTNQFRKQANLSTYEVLNTEINRVNDDAEKNLSQFIDFIEDVRMRSNGIEFVASIRTPRHQSNQFRHRYAMTQIIFKEQLSYERCSALTPKILKEIEGVHGTQDVTIKIEEIWRKEIDSILSDRQKIKKATEFNICNLIKAKLTFNTIEEMSRGIEVTDSICFLRGYEILGLNNRLTNRQSKDIVLTIKMHETVCEFQMTLRHDQHKHHISHNLHELESRLGYAIGSYLYLSQGFSYSLLDICESIEEGLSSSEKEADKKTVQAARYIVKVLSKK